MCLHSTVLIIFLLQITEKMLANLTSFLWGGETTMPAPDTTTLGCPEAPDTLAKFNIRATTPTDEEEADWLLVDRAGESTLTITHLAKLYIHTTGISPFLLHTHTHTNPSLYTYSVNDALLCVAPFKVVLLVLWAVQYCKGFGTPLVPQPLPFTSQSVPPLSSFPNPVVPLLSHLLSHTAWLSRQNTIFIISNKWRLC